MAQIPHIQPGDVIRASFINGLVDQVNALALGGPSTPTGVVVPNVIGQQLSQARTTLTQPAVNLALGTTFDTFGALVDPNAPASATRMVVGQSPFGGSRVSAGSAVDLLIAGQGGGPVVQPKPSITGFGAVSTPIGQPLTILGDNFDLTASKNIVTIDGVPAGVPNPASKTSLTVTVPNSAGVPKAVAVVVSINGVGSSNSMSTSILAALPNPNPSIAFFDTSPFMVARVGQPMKINGSFFSSTPANNTVMFDATPAVASAATATQITVTVPEIPGVNQGAGPKLVTLVVKVGSNSSNAFPNPPGFFVEKV